MFNLILEPKVAILGEQIPKKPTNINIYIEPVNPFTVIHLSLNLLNDVVINFFIIVIRKKIKINYI